jgi:hypothetical protein
MTYRSTVLVGALLIWANTVYAQESTSRGPAPRFPMGPHAIDASAMFPPNLNLQAGFPPSDRIRIQNLGNQTLSLSYWDAESTWKPISVVPGQATDVICLRCGSTITIAFHNGNESKLVPITTGNLYVLSWSNSLKLWDLTAASK